ncbi:hypothetical protein [Gorillibacterium massiliense]|uniref:hypothetical protein n=1 Tax=Gorillibacterium massiliense TaxID=1280390 RepID=UPI0004BCF85B|nr:hypothetical protein [Gorillibacterium massiliense]
MGHERIGGFFVEQQLLLVEMLQAELNPARVGVVFGIFHRLQGAVGGDEVNGDFVCNRFKSKIQEGGTS